MFTKNEIDGLNKNLPLIDFSLFDCVIAVDSNSNDGSIDLMKKYNIKVYQQPGIGIRDALWYGFGLLKTKYVMLFSPDNNSDPQIMHKLVDKIYEDYDLVIASRYKDNQISLDDDISSKYGNAFFTFLISLLFNYKFSDALNIYKIFKVDLLSELELNTKTKLKFDYIDLTLNWRAAKRRLNIFEISTVENARVDGSKASKAHPGFFGKYKSSIIFLYGILRDFILFK